MNTEDKLLTIIIPSYNMERYLGRCLDSLLVEDRHLFLLDILVVNDGSKDGTSRIGHQYEEKYPGIIRIVDKDNGHYGSCVNEGLRRAKGTFVKILDADDAFDTAVFSRFLDFLSDMTVLQKADLVLSDYCEVTENGDVFKQIRYRSNGKPFRLGDLMDDDRRKWFIHGLTYRCENLRNIGYSQSEGLPYTDHEWAFLPLTTINNIFKFDGFLYRYTVGRDGQSVAPEQHAKALPVEVRVVESMLRHYEKMPRMKTQSDQSFIEGQLIANVENIYCMYLMWLHPYVRSFEPLERFDQMLKEKYPMIYARTALYQTTVGRVHFHTIRNWRNGKKIYVKIQNIFYRTIDKLNHFR